MKTLIAAVLLVGSIQASATSLQPLVCESGVPGVGDSYMRAELLNGSVSYQRHESHLKVDASQTTTSGNTLAIVDKTITVQAEGDQFPVQVSALFVYSKDTHTLSATVIYDNHIQYARTEVLKCK